MISCRFTARILVSISLLGLGSAHAAAYEFSIINPIAGNFVEVHGINNLGQIVGSSSTSTSTTNRAAVMWHEGTATLLQAPAGGTSEAYAINDNGQIVGYRSGVNQPLQALIWDVPSQARPLAAIGVDGAVASSINNSGQIAGYSYVGNGVGNHAVVWDPAGGVQDLEIAGAYRSRANAINEAGVVAGESWDSGGNPRAAVWEGGKQFNLDNFGDRYSRAVGINDAGQMVGNTTAWGSPLTRAVIWEHTDSGVYSAEFLRGIGFSTDTYAAAINEQGNIVGASSPNSAGASAVIWTNKQVTDLNTLVDASVREDGWVLRVATAVNDLNWIVGLAQNERLGLYRPFLLTPAVPESSTLIMFGLGLMLLGLACPADRVRTRQVSTVFQFCAPFACRSRLADCS